MLKPNLELIILKKSILFKLALLLHSPWRASIPWWYSVGQMKYEDTSQKIISIYLSGKTYKLPQNFVPNANAEAKQFYDKQFAEQRDVIKSEFLKDFKSIIWMTYRKNFDGIANNSRIPKEHQHRSDSGWGCMLRSTQMLCANCILRHLYPDKPFSLSLIEENKEERLKYINLLWQYIN